MKDRELGEVLASRRELIAGYLRSNPPGGLEGGCLLNGVLEYVRRGGKCLRGMICLLSCGLAGGKEEDALPAAAAVEVFHVWTLVHDDIVDRDSSRRGGPTLHRHFRGFARSGHDADWYGLSLALLTGDIQQAWSVELLSKLSERVAPSVVLGLIRQMSGWAVPQLVAGEALDIELEGVDFTELKSEAILEMMEKKTAVLYCFAGRAGAQIGLGSCEEHPYLTQLERFLRAIGIAFQLRDDLLGVTSTAEALGKDPDSDIREGKRTLIAALAYERSGAADRKLLEGVLGKPNATTEEVQAVKNLFLSSGAIAAVQSRSKQLVQDGLTSLGQLPETPQRELLERLAFYLVERES